MRDYNGRNGNGYQPRPIDNGKVPQPPRGDSLTLKGWQQENAELQDEVLRLRKAAEDWHDLAMRTERENRRLQKFATQRGARMQIMREWMHGQPAGGLAPGSVLDDFEDDRPESVEWFDGNGVPVDA